MFGWFKAEAVRAFMFEAIQLRLVCGQTLGEKLERDFAPESFVPRKIDLAHSTDADERLDPVMTD